MTIDEAIKIIKSECYTANLLNLDRTQMVNTALDLAIKALEQQPRDNNWKFYYDHGYAQAKRDLLCDDCISRQAVLDIINFEDEWLHDANSHNADTKIAFSGLESRVKALPPVTPKAKWIPVSERLPEDYIHVLCQFYLGGMGECYLAHGAFHVVGGLVMTCNEVVAWMPLPEPYQAESRGEE